MEYFLRISLKNILNYDQENKIENPIILEKIYILFFTKDSTKMDLECEDLMYLFYCGIYYIFIEKNLEQAKYWLKKASLLGNVKAMRHLGLCYYDINTQTRAKETKYWLEKASLLGDVESMNCLGLYFKDENNLEQAKFWYEKAAELGNASAMNNLGYYYYYDIENNLEQAKFWFEKSSQLGNKKALKLYFQLCSKNKTFYRDLFNSIDLETIENQFPKFKHFWNGRKKFITHDDCSICYEKTELIPFDCFNHSYCLPCYITIDKCAYCETKKTESFVNDVLFSLTV